MSQDLVTTTIGSVLENKIITEEGKSQFLTMTVAGQSIGIPINLVRDVLAPQKITNVPLAPKEVIGSLNLRGRIVTAIDLRVILGLDAKADLQKNMSVVAEHNNELYSFIVDCVEEVLSIATSEFADNPSNFPKSWQDLSLGICPLKDKLLVIIDIKKVLQNISEKKQ